MFKKLLPYIVAIVFIFQMQSAFGQSYTITTVSETAYSGGTPTTSISTCTQDSIVYRITESSPTTDSIKIKLPDGITFVRMLSDSNATVTYRVFEHDSVPTFKVIPTGAKFKLTILVNTPPCNALHSSYQYTHIWGLNSSNTYIVTDLLSILTPSLVVADSSKPSPIELGVGNVDEFVFAVTNLTAGTDISKIYFHCSPNPNVQLYSQYYLTYNSSRGLEGYYNKYTYNRLPHSYSYTLLPSNIIDSLTINSLLGGGELVRGDTIYVHIPYQVESCDGGSGSFQFWTVCPLDTNTCDSVSEATSVIINVGNPLLATSVDTLDLASFCSKIRKDSSEVKFRYVNNGGSWYSNPPGNGRADSLRIYIGSTTAAGHIDTSTIRINNHRITGSYITTRIDGFYTVNEINLVHYPANPTTGLAFGNNTIQDLDGYGYADAIAEKDTFYVTARFIYDTASCNQFTQCGNTTLYLPSTWAKYNNECFTLPRNDARVDTNITITASYQYAASSGASTITTPADILSNTEFPLTICPSYAQQWQPLGFGFDCHHPYYSITVPLPANYRLDIADPSIGLVTADGNSHQSNLYDYLSTYTATGPCSHNVETLPHPLIRELYNGPDTTLTINFGRVDSDNCSNYSQAYLLSCINIPLILACNPAIHNGYIDTVPFTLQYTCDSACSDCSDILTCNSTTTYNHPCGSSNTIPYTTNTDLSIFRTNLGYINQELPKYYTRTCSTADSAVIPTLPTDTLKDKSNTLINLDAGYPGDQVETIVEGGYDSLVPSSFLNEYLQITHPVYAGSPHKGFLFELDPTLKSYFILHGCSSRISALNGDTLFLPNHHPFYTDTSSGTVGSPVEMNFSIDSAMNNSYPSLYSLFIADDTIEHITVTAHLHLRVWNPGLPNSSYYMLNGGSHVVNLRNDYMALEKPGGFSADSLHSSDTWGTNFTILQPDDNGVYLSNGGPSACAPYNITFVFGAGVTYLLSQDFPNEFRPFYELDSVVTITLPAGYIYDSASFYTYMDNYTTYADSNYFRGGSDRTYFKIRPFYNSNPLNNPSLATTLKYIGLNNSCWPLIDQKFPNYPDNQGYYLTITTLPVCNVKDTATFYSTAGYRMCTQQGDTNFQIHYLPRLDSTKVIHINPEVTLGVPPEVTDYSNRISFTFTLCDSGSYAAYNGWVAFENRGGDTLNFHTATLTNLYTHHTYFPNLYNGTNGVFFNAGTIGVSTCDTFLFSAVIDSDSRSCPPPRDSGVGKLVVRFGNTCNDTLLNPDYTVCENKVDTFYYHVYHANLIIANNGHSPDTISLCAGVQLVDSLTITSDDLGTISDPEFWITPPPGVTFDSVRFTYPCGGAKDTNVHVPDTSFYGHGGTIATLGWNLNKDLKLDGLRGTLGLPPLSDSNSICVVVKMSLNCGYHGKPILLYTTGVTTCDIVDTAEFSFTPAVDSSCCPHTCWAYDTFDVTINNTSASALGHSYYDCERIRINGTYTVDENVTIDDCNIAFAPYARINITNNSILNITTNIPCNNSIKTSHLYAACDTMWRGIFVNPGSEVSIFKNALIEDADTAIVAINSPTAQGIYDMGGITFNKNYKDIVVEPCTTAYQGLSGSCVYTCRNLSLLSYSPYVSYYTTASLATLLYPHLGQTTVMGWEIDSVHDLEDGTNVDHASYGSNAFDNMVYGIYGLHSNLRIYSDTFSNIVSSNSEIAAIYSRGGGAIGSGDTLLVGARPSMYGPYGNIFKNCNIGVLADTSFKYVDVAYNKMTDYNKSPGNYGIAVAAMNVSGDSLHIDQDTITNFNVGIACNLNTYPTAYINYNVISVDTCTNLNWTGIVINETSATANYTVDSNTISTYYRGIFSNGVSAPTINDNKITLDPSGCSSYLSHGTGILLQSSNNAQVGCNYITVGDTVNTYTAIEESSSQKVTILNNTTIHTNRHIWFNGTPYINDLAKTNTIDLATGDTGIVAANGASVTLGSLANGCDNTFTGTSGVYRTSALTPFYYAYVSIPAYYPYPGGPLPTDPTALGSTGLTCTSVLSRSRSHSMERHSPDSMSLDSATLISLENIAFSKDSLLNDTNLIIAKGGVLTTLWNNTYLLSNPVFRHFNDSMSNAPMGEIMAIDTTMTDTNANATSLLNSLNAIIPANNIEANMQTATWGYLNYKINSTLSSGELAILHSLANKCSYWDGLGVYQARALLSLFDPPSTVYPNECESREKHKPVKNTLSNQNPEPIFDLYPNPNNGNFTLDYNLGQDETGRVIIFNTIGEQVGEYTLNGSEGTMNVSNPNLSNGVYLWKLYSNNQIIKYGKVIIIR